MSLNRNCTEPDPALAVIRSEVLTFKVFTGCRPELNGVYKA